MEPRPVAKLRESVERRLTAYAMAAGASGVLLAICPPAAGKIAYTKTNTDLAANTPLPLDLNHDGITDFSLYFSIRSRGFDLFAMAEPANQVAGYCRRLSQSCWASALRPDIRVGANRRFGPYNYMLAGGCSTSGCFGSGPWDNVQRRYLGFRFVINGKVHYGWARLNVDTQNVAAVLTGYAYETVPNKPLVTGKTKGPDVITLRPRTLGHLARGASAIRE
jgi:hypothetical protein